MGPDSAADEIQRFEEQYRRQPESLVFARLADAYRKAGQPDRALSVLEEGLRRHPDYPSGHIVQARTLRDLGRLDETLESFRRVLELDGSNLVAIRELADLAEQRGDVGESLHWHRRLVQIDPSDRDVERRVRELEASVSAAVGAPTDESGESPVEEASPAMEGPQDWWDDSAVDLASPAAGGEPGGLEENPEAPFEGPAPRPEDEVVEAILNGAVPETVRAEDTWWYEEAPADVEAEPSSDADLLTRTMGDLYAEQGLHREAADIYEELLRDTPDDPELLGRLERVRETIAADEAKRGGSVVGEGLPAASGEVSPDAEPAGRPAGMPWTEELRGLLRAGEEKARTLPDPEPAEKPAPEAPPADIRESPAAEPPHAAVDDGQEAPAREEASGMSRFATEWLRELES